MRSQINKRLQKLKEKEAMKRTSHAQYVKQMQQQQQELVPSSPSSSSGERRRRTRNGSEDLFPLLDGEDEQRDPPEGSQEESIEQIEDDGRRQRGRSQNRKDIANTVDLSVSTTAGPDAGAPLPPSTPPTSSTRSTIYSPSDPDRSSSFMSSSSSQRPFQPTSPLTSPSPPKEFLSPSSLSSPSSSCSSSSSSFPSPPPSLFLQTNQHRLASSSAIKLKPKNLLGSNDDNNDDSGRNNGGLDLNLSKRSKGLVHLQRQQKRLEQRRAEALQQKKSAQAKKHLSSKRHTSTQHHQQPVDAADQNKTNSGHNDDDDGVAVKAPTLDYETFAKQAGQDENRGSNNDNEGKIAGSDTPRDLTTETTANRTSSTTPILNPTRGDEDVETENDLHGHHLGPKSKKSKRKKQRHQSKVRDSRLDATVWRTIPLNRGPLHSIQEECLSQDDEVPIEDSRVSEQIILGREEEDTCEDTNCTFAKKGEEECLDEAVAQQISESEVYPVHFASARAPTSFGPTNWNIERRNDSTDTRYGEHERRQEIKIYPTNSCSSYEYGDSSIHTNRTNGVHNAHEGTNASVEDLREKFDSLVEQADRNLQLGFQQNQTVPYETDFGAMRGSPPSPTGSPRCSRHHPSKANNSIEEHHRDWIFLDPPPPPPPPSKRRSQGAETSGERTTENPVTVPPGQTEHEDGSAERPTMPRGLAPSNDEQVVNTLDHDEISLDAVLEDSKVDSWPHDFSQSSQTETQKVPDDSTHWENHTLEKNFESSWGDFNFPRFPADADNKQPSVDAGAFSGSSYSSDEDNDFIVRYSYSSTLSDDSLSESTMGSSPRGKAVWTREVHGRITSTKRNMDSEEEVVFMAQEKTGKSRKVQTVSSSSGSRSSRERKTTSNFGSSRQRSTKEDVKPPDTISLVAADIDWDSAPSARSESCSTDTEDTLDSNTAALLKSLDTMGSEAEFDRVAVRECLMSFRKELRLLRKSTREKDGIIDRLRDQLEDRNHSLAILEMERELNQADAAHARRQDKFREGTNDIFAGWRHRFRHLRNSYTHTCGNAW